MIEIIPYEEQYQHAFKQLNLYWLDHYGLTESHDLEILNDPLGVVLAMGGCIFLARDDDKIIGTAGLFKKDDQEFELIKMAVDPKYHGRGIGKLLLEKCLVEARQRKATKISLFSNHQLRKALTLYEKFGFTYKTVTDSPFLTADVRMELVI